MSHNLEKINEIPLHHLPNDAKLVLQRQKNDYIADDTIQLYIATNFLNAENGNTVWNKGFSIQMNQIPELIKMLQDAQKKYSENVEKTVTFADSTYV